MCHNNPPIVVDVVYIVFNTWGVCKQLNYTPKYSADIYTMYELLVGKDNLNHYIPWSAISFFQAYGKSGLWYLTGLCTSKNKCLAVNTHPWLVAFH